MSIQVDLLAPYEDDEGMRAWIPFRFTATPDSMRRKPDRLDYSDMADVMTLLTLSFLGRAS